jgi:hypothetical protein
MKMKVLGLAMVGLGGLVLALDVAGQMPEGARGPGVSPVNVARERSGQDLSRPAARGGEVRVPEGRRKAGPQTPQSRSKARLQAIQTRLKSALHAAGAFSLRPRPGGAPAGAGKASNALNGPVGGRKTFEAVPRASAALNTAPKRGAVEGAPVASRLPVHPAPGRTAGLAVLGGPPQASGKNGGVLNGTGMSHRP